MLKGFIYKQEIEQKTFGKVWPEIPLLGDPCDAHQMLQAAKPE